MSLEIPIDSTVESLQHLLLCARGEKPCDLVLKNASVINIFSNEIKTEDVGICGNRIAGIGRYSGNREIDLGGKYLSPGFIEGHIHIESSMLSPHRFAEAVVPKGTTTVICDPHEIANVLGLEGVRYMLACAEGTPLDIFAMVPSCVPATHLETSGATLASEDIAHLLEQPGIVGLGEMMNFPGTIYGDGDVLMKLGEALARDMVIDGHAPGVGGKELQAYCAAGISSDHECTTIEEAREKLRVGMYIFIREGSTAKNLEALLPLVTPATCDRFLLVSDDRHPDDLISQGHLDAILRRAVALGIDALSALRMVTINPAERFGLKMRGAIAPGYLADLVVLSDLTDFQVEQVFKEGHLVAELERPIKSQPAEAFIDTDNRLMQSVHIDWQKVDFRIPAHGHKKKIRVIDCIEDQIVTGMNEIEPTIVDGYAIADPTRDLLKISVIERHHAGGTMTNGFVRGFGFTNGAIASTVAHDSHNLIVVGTDDDLMLAAARLVADNDGGLSLVCGDENLVLPLPIAGLMSDQPPAVVADQLTSINKMARRMGVRVANPYMLLSFLALPVIPTLKITDKGLVDVTKFAFTSLWL